MKREVTIRNLQKRIRVNKKAITTAALIILKTENVAAADLSIVFVTDKRMRSLNKKYLKRDRSTDVLAFDLTFSLPSRTKQPKKKTSLKPIIGEIFISTDTAVKNSRIFQTTPLKESMLYMAHGILHLLGFDDHSKTNIRRMRKKEQKILQYLKV